MLVLAALLVAAMALVLGMAHSWSLIGLLILLAIAGAAFDHLRGMFR